MSREDDNIALQAHEHALVPTEGFRTLEEYGLYLLHLRAYEEIAALARGRAVLDVGCNVGYGTKLLAANARRAVGVDVSPAAIEQARRSCEDERIEYRVVDGKTLPFEDGTFDLAASLQVIEHIADVDTYLAEIKRCLAPGGQAAFTTVNAAIRLEPGMKPLYRFHVREYTADELAETLGRHFPDVRVRGLFATGELYEAEIARNARALATAKRFGGLPLKLRNMLPHPLLRRLKALRHRAKGEKLDAAVMDRYSTADCFYREADLDRALDLLAICRPGPPAADAGGGTADG